MQFTVQDDGIGMTEERLLEVQNSIVVSEEQEQQRIGLRNVHQRLVLSYGEDHGLKITSVNGKGTQIRFTIPVYSN
ncbi:Histidine kinase-, DNA gyrase B-, and HSP90-like ATPase [compost metagenome]